MSNDASRTAELDERWPRDGDRVFVGASWAHDAHVVRDPTERFYRLPMGYKRAADLLVQRAASNPVDRANIIYAALFCYRQSIELFIKRLIDEFGDCRPDNTHSLRTLFNQLMQIFGDRGREETLGLGAAKALILEMDEADSRSDGFRFPVNPRGQPFEFGDQGIDLANLEEVMAGLSNFFECAYLDFSHQDDAASTFLR
jgi:hypothetical protein